MSVSWRLGAEAVAQLLMCWVCLSCASCVWVWEGSRGRRYHLPGLGAKLWCLGAVECLACVAGSRVSTRCSSWLLFAFTGADLSHFQCSHVLSVSTGGLLLSYLSLLICSLICIVGFRDGDCLLVLAKRCVGSWCSVTVTAAFKRWVVLLLTPVNPVTYSTPVGVAW